MQNDLDAIDAKYEALKKENEEAITQKITKAQKQLKDKIYQDISSLQAQEFSLSSITDENLYFRVGNYSGSIGKEGWNYTLSVKIGGKTVYTDTGLLTYKEITGKDVPDVPRYSDKDYSKKKALYDEYLDAVDSYDSFFRLNVPYVEAAVSYTVSADKPRYPSRYNINIKKLTFTVITNSSIIKNINADKNAKYQYTPSVSVDWTDDGGASIADIKDSSGDASDTSEASGNGDSNAKTSSNNTDKDTKTSSSSDSSTAGGRNSFSFLIVPGNINFYSSANDDTCYTTFGYNLFLGLSDHIFIGGTLEMDPISMLGYFLDFAIASLFDTTVIYIDDGDSYANMHLTLTAALGFNINLTKNLRLSVIGEAGIINSKLGAGIGGTVEFYGRAFGVYGGYSYTITSGSSQFHKFSLGVEFVF